MADLLMFKKTVFVTLSRRHDPETFYKYDRSRKDLYAQNAFYTGIAQKARPTEAGTRFKIGSAEISRVAPNYEIRNALRPEHIFSETAACAVIAEMIAQQPKDETGELGTKGQANLFYTRLFAVDVFLDFNGETSKWKIFVWSRVGHPRDDARVFYPID